jgi:Holliday junction resolvase
MAFGTYKKGSRAEHELIKMLMGQGYSVIRAAGSGGGTPCPDVLAFKRIDQFGFECKSVESQSLQLRTEQIEHLKQWELNTNITTFIAWRQRGGNWLFVRVEHVKKTEKGYSLTLKQAKLFGIELKQLLRIS